MKATNFLAKAVLGQVHFHRAGEVGVGVQPEHPLEALQRRLVQHEGRLEPAHEPR